MPTTIEKAARIHGRIAQKLEGAAVPAIRARLGDNIDYRAGVAPVFRLEIREHVVGERAAIEWRQEDPNYLSFTPLSEPPRLIRRNGAGARPIAGHASRIPAGHPEGYLEAFAQLYADLAEQITARIENRAPDPMSLLVPDIADGVAGMRFIEGVLESSRRNAAWVQLSIK